MEDLSVGKAGFIHILKLLAGGVNCLQGSLAKIA